MDNSTESSRTALTLQRSILFISLAVLGVTLYGLLFKTSHTHEGSPLSPLAKIKVIKNYQVQIAMSEKDEYQVEFVTAGSIQWVTPPAGASYLVRDALGAYLTVGTNGTTAIPSAGMYTIVMHCPKSQVREIMLIAN